jgi:hypothetical protein
MDALWHDIQHAYETHIEAAGKELHFLLLLSFLCSFGFIRTSAHMIRAQVSWWPGNVETKGGTHIHHFVWGILLLLTMGYLGLSFDLGTPWIELVVIAFGLGMGLTLDEFALWLNLKDVYWQGQGRQSIDAVVVTATLLVISLLGLQFWIDVREAILLAIGVGGESFVGDESALLLLALQLIGAGLAAICFLKGKTMLGVVGLFIPMVALFGAVTKATADSRWERRRRAPPARSSA